MAAATVGILHPGQMGAAVAAALVASGHRVLWCSAGRREATAARADAAGAERCESLASLLALSELVISVCPPHGAEEVAREVAAAGFGGLYADLNAISPARAVAVAATVEKAGAHPADGGIVGPPPRQSGTTRLYLSGGSAPPVRDVFQGTALEPVLLAGGIGQASAFKMAYASLTKGSAALAAISRALAVRHGVEEALLAEWARGPFLSSPGTDAALSRTASVAWRWIAEMGEIAETCRAAGLPGEMHDGAGMVFRRWERRRDQLGVPIADLLAQLSAEETPLSPACPPSSEGGYSPLAGPGEALPPSHPPA